jgi:hypothetical protein
MLLEKVVTGFNSLIDFLATGLLYVFDESTIAICKIKIVKSCFDKRLIL